MAEVWATKPSFSTCSASKSKKIILTTTNGGMWTLVYSNYHNEDCPGNNPIGNAYPKTYVLFKPIDPGDPTILRTYRLWFYTRQNYPLATDNGQTPCYDGSCYGCGYCGTYLRKIRDGMMPSRCEVKSCCRVRR